METPLKEQQFKKRENLSGSEEFNGGISANRCALTSVKAYPPEQKPECCSTAAGEIILLADAPKTS